MSDLARKLIAENKTTKATFLDLGNCDLTEIPSEIGELLWLESLSIASEWFEWDGNEWQTRHSQNSGGRNKHVRDLNPSLSLLRSLVVSSSQVTDLEPIAALANLQSLSLLGAQVADFLPIAALTNLQTLYLSSPQLADLVPIATLTNLQTLSLSSAQVADLMPIAALTNLQTLSLLTDQLRDLKPIAGCINLRSLRLSSTQVTDLKPLAACIHLRSLSLSGTRVDDLKPLAASTNLRSLDFARTQVADLKPLAGLANLQSLTFFGTQVADLAPIGACSNLLSLSLSSTRVNDLHPLAALVNLQLLDVSYTQVVDCKPLAHLVNLHSLNVSYTQVADLEPLATLANLQSLSATTTKVADLKPLAALINLRSLNIVGTQVTDLDPLTNLANLQSLDIADTQVTDLAPLTKLANLQSLNISRTQVTDIAPLKHFISQGWPVVWHTKAWRGLGIYVEGCSLIRPPVHIVNQGNNAILNYFRELDSDDVDHLYEAKMLILGEGRAGKTSLLRRLYQPDKPLPSENETTKGIDIHRHEFTLKNGRRFRLNVWDFGGQEIYHATHQFFLTRRSLYLLLDDTGKDHKSVSDEGFKQWLELIDLFGDHSPVLIFQNEKGGRSKSIDFAGIKGRFDNVKERYAGNLERPDAADALREGIEYFAANLSHIGEELPARWIKVREEIETRANEVPYVTHQEYFSIYSKHMEFDRTKALYLSRYLHDLGVFLHFQDDPLLARIVILQNPWATDAVYRILDDESVKSHFGRFDGRDCARLWRDSNYADMQPELLSLMQRFELCYELRDSQPQNWLAPQLLPPAKPAALAGWNKPDDLVLRYRYDFMPKGILSRLTVRLHRFVRNPEMAWGTGVIFERDSTAVLVERLPSGNEIELRGRGPERKALLTVVAADLDDLNECFQGLREKVDKRIPCNCKKCSAENQPEFFAQRNLLKRKDDSRLKVKCPASYEDMNVLELLDGVRVDKLPAWAEEKPQSKATRTVKIFLASSSDLKEDREAFDLYCRQQNDRLLEDGFYLKIVRWENFLDAMSETRLQDEYNKAICDCDIFVSLFFTKTGKFTEEEFETAHQQFMSNKKPLIYTFFKNAQVSMGSVGDEVLSLLKFKKKLADLGHFYTSYNNIEHLKQQFRDQLDKLKDDLKS